MATFNYQLSQRQQARVEQSMRSLQGKATPEDNRSNTIAHTKAAQRTSKSGDSARELSNTELKPTLIASGIGITLLGILLFVTMLAVPAPSALLVLLGSFATVSAIMFGPMLLAFSILELDAESTQPLQGRPVPVSRVARQVELPATRVTMAPRFQADSELPVNSDAPQSSR